MEFSKGLICSIQGFSQTTTQELAEISINSGASAIRTDQPIFIKDVQVIGLKKLQNKPYYITTSRDAILEVSKWTNNIAIDSRKGNDEIMFLYSLCHIMQLNIFADIESVDDVVNILKLCDKGKIELPKYFVTTFNYNSPFKIENIKEIKNITNIPLIAEGGYEDVGEYIKTMEYVNNICIGNAIFGIQNKIKKYAEAI